MLTTPGQILVNQALPEGRRDHSRQMDGDSLAKLMGDIGHEDGGGAYKDVSHKLAKLGFDEAYLSGVTLKLSNLAPPVDRSGFFAHLDKQDDEIDNAPELSDEERDGLRSAVYSTISDQIRSETYDRGVADGNPLAEQVKAKARGDKLQLAAVLSTPGEFSDAKGRPIPVYPRRSYAEGLSPAEWYSASYGTRQGVISTKFATPIGGDLGKQLSLASSDLVVSEDDCGTAAGVPFNTADPDNAGALLARDVGAYKAGSPVTPKMQAELRDKHPEILLRSPISCKAKGGVCAKCAGLAEDGNPHPLLSNLGVKASSALAERVAQGSLNCLVEGTLVRMADFTVKPIEQIVAGDQVLGSDEYGSTFVTTVTGVWDQGLQPASRYTFKRGSTRETISLESTEIHPVLMNTKVTSQKEEIFNHAMRVLPVGKKLRDIAAVLPSSFNDNRAVTIEEPHALMIGLMLGDGGCTGAYPLLSCADATLIRDVQDELMATDIRLVRRKSSYDWALVQAKKDRSDSFGQKGFRNTAKIKLAEVGMLGKYAHEKTMPANVHSWSKRSLSKLMAGLYATDGSVYSSKNGHIGLSYGSTSRALLDQIREILEIVFCVRTTAVTRVGKAGSGNRTHDMFQFTITRLHDVRKFAEQIIIPGVKGLRLSALLASAEYEPSGEMYRCRKVKSEPLGLRRCWDLSVANASSLFVLANGLIVHNTKHLGRGAGKSAKPTGTALITQLVQVPAAFRGRAPLAEAAGAVVSVSDAPQGGLLIDIGGQEHYAEAGLAALVKPGDIVEEGDALTEGEINPADVVRLKGIGEGRRYYAERLTSAFKDSKLAANRRNVEVSARANIDHVNVTDADNLSGWLPGDVASYSAVESAWAPREGAVRGAPAKMVGKYLEEPALHHTIGTPITRKVAEQMERFGVGSVLAHAERPGFMDEMVRLREAPHNKKDWMAKLRGTYLTKNLLEDARVGASASIHGLSPVAGMAYGAEFGRPPKGSVGY